MTTATGTIAADIDAVQLHLNKGEMVLVAHLMAVPRDSRMAAATALRGRSRADAVRFAHSGELASRNIELFAAVVGSGVVTAEHLDLIWGRLHRQLVTVPVTRHEEILGHLDTAVNTHVTPWLRDAATPVSLTELRDRVDEAILDIAPGLAAETALAEEDSATLRRRGNTFIFTAGCETTSAAIDAGLEKRMRELLAGLRRERVLVDEDDRTPLPTPSQIKAQILMELLGNTPEAMTIRVNLYRATLDGIHGTGAGYVADVGWINARTADRFEGAATVVKEIPVDPAEHPESDGYPFRLQDRNYLEGRDGTCRFPQCTVPANLCENDHIENSPFTDPTSNGPTSVRNGQKLCRAHHRLKTGGTWTCSTQDDGFTIDWTDPAGRGYTTHATGPLARAWQRGRGRTDEPPD
ncbi:HNH endonuclease signature motif containing protein [Corynebacterium sp. USCH3]|uniref:HNH endonuclease signature motif containing protein n=1 Tax=Corynebacterium sp. USCH3 TaxID=3024840 RepID=UPI0030A6A4D2